MEFKMTQKNRLIVTNVTIHEKKFCCCAYYQGGRLTEVELAPADVTGDSENLGKSDANPTKYDINPAKSMVSPTKYDVNPAKSGVASGILGNIYVGRVQKVVKSLNAAFVEIAPGHPGYLSLKDASSPIYVKRAGKTQLVQGDELVVQVEVEAAKNKPPRVTGDLSFHGQYLALSTKNGTVGVSKKLSDEQRKHLKEMLTAHRLTGFGIVARTACREGSDEQILQELMELEHDAAELISHAPHRACYSCLRRQEPFYIQMLRRVFGGGVDEVVTDLPEAYESLKQCCAKAPRIQDSPPRSQENLLRLYEDPLLPLAKCYSLEHHLLEALKERVWLKSGACLVIQRTEALTVIDVNSGKSAAKGDPQAHYLKVNLEAAAEIARQLRLRNISGIIIVDFIDLKSKEDQEKLMAAMRALVQADPTPTTVVDLTRLNLMELTRKKVRQSVGEQVGDRSLAFAM